MRLCVLCLLATLLLPTAVTGAPSPLLNPLIGNSRSLKLASNGPGVVELRWADLAAAGWDLAATPAETIRVWWRGSERAAEVNEHGLRFIAEDGGRYSTQTVYWLSSDGVSRARRVAQLEATSLPFIWGPDHIYQSLAQAVRGDRWFAGELRSGAAPLQASFNLPSAAAAGSTLAIGLTPLVHRAGHRLVVASAAGQLGEVQWDDPPGNSGPLTVTLTLAHSLPAGPNQISLALAPSTVGDSVLVDELALVGVRLPLPTLPTPALEPASLSHDPQLGPASGQPGADQLIISHRNFLAALAPLVAAKRAAGGRVALLDVQLAYDAYSFGERDPAAIRALIQVAARHWNPRPTSILLVGAGSVRLRQAPGQADESFIPPYLVDIDPKNGEIACDTCYTRLDSADVHADPMPDLAIGRLPVHSPAEASALVRKLLATLQPPVGAWQFQALSLSDNDRQADGSTDPAGPFVALAEAGIQALPGGFRVQRFAYAPDATSGNGFYRDSGSLRRELFAAWDAGAALLIYSGHASPWQWGYTTPNDPAPHLVALHDASVRRNGSRLPLLLDMSCNSGNWANPTLPTTDEALLLNPDGGIAAALAPTGSGVNTGHQRLLVATLAQLGKGHSLGTAHLSGLAALVSSGRDLDLTYSYGILGDPESRLALLPQATVHVPLVVR